MGNVYKQKYGCAMGSPVYPIVANLYIDKVDKGALNSCRGITQINNSKTQWTSISRLHGNKHRITNYHYRLYVTGQEGDLDIELYGYPTHTDQYLLFESHHPLEYKLGVIRTLQHDEMVTKVLKTLHTDRSALKDLTTQTGLC